MHDAPSSSLSGRKKVGMGAYMPGKNGLEWGAEPLVRPFRVIASEGERGIQALP
jgi:hypothetical protein